MYSTGKSEGYIAEKAEINSGWLFPVGDEAHELGYPNMFTDMFDAIENNRSPLETFYDGYVVNAILDAAFLSAKTKQWQPVVLDIWRGDDTNIQKESLVSFDEEHYLVKEETLPNGDQKLILKNKVSGIIIQKTNKL